MARTRSATPAGPPPWTCCSERVADIARPPGDRPRSARTPFPEGAFVLTNFPFGPPNHRPENPGPESHIAYVLGHRQGRTGPQMLLAYTSSGPWRGAAPGTPLGVIEFDDAAARAVNQRPFHLDLRCLARATLTKRWFPRIDHPDRGIVAIAGPALRNRIFRAAGALAARSPQIIEIRGVPP